MIMTRMRELTSPSIPSTTISVLYRTTYTPWTSQTRRSSMST
jgi:hypothetical protein